MTRIAKRPIVLLLLAPLLLGAAVPAKRADSKDPAIRHETAKAISSLSTAPASTPRPSVMTATSPGGGKGSPSAASTTSTYTINWSSINGGGLTNSSSPNYSMGNSMGQSVAGSATSASYQMGTGFWYGAGGGCSCPSQGDINSDAVIDVFDVIGVIGIAFSGDPDPQDPGCPRMRGDVDNNGVTDVFDVIYLIATAFSGGASPVNPCGP
ncbi:MAG: hypothetical protein HZB43_00980 [candidate division Zixibacteria bacterium]|nr:hypothetical protein [candidate division Zixibacteria bacterium]